ncbi:MAG: DNA-directed RNA polymerase subunit omega [Candidatus Polarisedimenticolia bacterium]
MRVLQYPDDMSDRFGGKFKFIAVASLRCRQLQKGARTRVTSRSKKFTTVAQEEVLAGLVAESVVLPVQEMATAEEQVIGLPE